MTNAGTHNGKDGRTEDGNLVTRIGADVLHVTLTPAEHRVLERLMLGETNKEIAVQLECSPRTVEFHLAQIFKKAKVDGRGRLMSIVASGRFGVEVR